MKNRMLFGSLRIVAFAFAVVSLTALAGADDKNKKPANTPPPPPPRQVQQQPSRPSTPPAHTPATQMPHPANTQAPHTTNTQMPHTNTQVPRTGNTQMPHTGTTSTQQGNRVTGTNGSQVGTQTGVRTGVNGNLQNGRNIGTGPAANTGSKPPSTTLGSRNGPVRGPTNGPSPLTRSGPPGRGPVTRFAPAPRNDRVFGDKRASFDRGGHLREIHARGMELHRTMNHQRTFVAERNGRRIVGLGPHRGYVQRVYPGRDGRMYVQRTYVVGSVRYAAVYRSYSWRGVAYYHYVPAFYYRPAFYGWAYSPWSVHVAWGWGWGGAPWYGYYGYYFAPYPVYPAPAFWLTDYVLAANLQMAYADRGGPGDGPQDAPGDGEENAQPAAPATVQLSPEVKQMIADEVQRQLAAERDAAQSAQPSQPAPGPADSGAGGAAPEETPSALSSNSRVFIVSSTLDVTKDDGSECSLTAGDVILRSSDTPDGTKVGVNVVTSKRGDCPSNTSTAVDVSDLEEMQNQFRQQLDSGLKALSEDQGKNGMPSAPDTTTTASGTPVPAPDPSAGNDIVEQQKTADQVETDVQRASVQGKPGN